MMMHLQVDVVNFVNTQWQSCEVQQLLNISVFVREQYDETSSSASPPSTTTTIRVKGDN